MTAAYYKVLDENGRPFHGGTGTWHLPAGKRAGKWMPKIDRLEPCNSGYHVCTPDQLGGWLGPVIYEVEVRGEVVDAGDKTVVQQARLIRRLDTWHERTARLFACDCAETVVHLADDARSVEAIAVARRYANGEATKDELAAARDAARDAAWAAARDAARDAAWDVARAAQTAGLFAYINGDKP